MSDSQDVLIDEVRKLGFASTSPEFIAAISQIATFTDLPAGTLVFTEGEVHEQMYFICEGTVSLEMVTANCGKQRILTMGPGDLLAWSGLLGDGRMTSTASTLEPTRLIEIPVAALRSLCESDHEIGYIVMTRVAKALSRRLLATRLQLIDLYHVEEA